MFVHRMLFLTPTGLRKAEARKEISKTGAEGQEDRQMECKSEMRKKTSFTLIHGLHFCCLLATRDTSHHSWLSQGHGGQSSLTQMVHFLGLFCLFLTCTLSGTSPCGPSRLRKARNWLSFWASWVSAPPCWHGRPNAHQPGYELHFYVFFIIQVPQRVN